MIDHVASLSVYIQQHEGTVSFDSIVENQVANIKRGLAGIKNMTAEHATKLTEAVNSGCWPADAKEELFQAINLQLTGMPSDNKYQQLEEGWDNYVPASMKTKWQQSSSAEVLEDVADLMVKLELHNSSEQTKGHVVAKSLQLASVAWASADEFRDVHLKSFKKKLKVIYMCSKYTTITVTIHNTLCNILLIANAHCMQAAKLKHGQTRVVDIVWRYPVRPFTLPKQLFDKVYKDDPPSSNTTKTLAINLAPGSLRKIPSGAFTNSNTHAAQAYMNAIMGMPSSSSVVPNITLPSSSAAPNMFGNNAQLNAFMQFMQVMGQFQGGGTPPPPPRGNIRLYTPPPGGASPPQDSPPQEPPTKRLQLHAPPRGTQLAALTNGAGGDGGGDDADDDSSDVDPALQAEIMAAAAAAAKPGAKPGAKSKAKAKAKAKAQAILHRPAAVLRRPASAGRVRDWTMAQRIAQRPNGCSKCRRQTPGCCPSCWGSKW